MALVAQFLYYQLHLLRWIMVKHEESDVELSELQIRDVIERAEVTTPVLAYKVAGNRVELHLLGGPVAYVEADWLVEPDEALDLAVETAVDAAADLLDDLEEMTYDALYKLAQRLDVRGRSVMEEPELRAAIRTKGVISNS
jgi:hypothetical protein